MDWILQLIPFLRSRKAKQELDLAAMAAVPAEVLPPVKSKKRDPSCLETSPAVLATSTVDWSSLSADLVRRIADSFLATNDVDCYMDLRAVCHSWRAATDDPKNNAFDVRFRPRTWIVLDEVFQTDDRRILLNTATGRFLRKKLPLLLDYYVVATTPSGFFVLADRSSPHAARVFNPLTGNVVRLAAPVPPEVGVAYAGSCDESSSLGLVLLGDSSRKLYTSVPDTEHFVSRDYQQGGYNFFRKAAVGGAYPHISGPGSFGAIAKLRDLLLHGDFAKFFSTDLPGDANDIRCFLVGVAAHMVLVVKTHEALLVFKINTEIGEIEPVQSITRFAIFIGHHRCLPVDADKYPGIEANCVYYTEHLSSSARICKYNLKDKKAERISGAAEFVKQDKQFALVVDRPFTTIQLLCSYTINSRDSELALQKMS